MSELNRVAKTFLAYMKRPDLYPELGRKVYKNVFRRKAAFKGKEKTNKWAADRAISQEKAIEQLFNIQSEPFKSVFPEVFRNSLEIERKCPIKMGGAGAMELIYYACEYTQATKMIETGVAYGWSSLASLSSLHKRKGTLYSSDMPYLSQNGDQYVGCIVPENLKKYWKLYRYADKESLPKILSEISTVDLVHYDSDKSYDGMFWAYNTLFPVLKKGGVFISDDINDNSAFQDFCEKENIEPTIIDFEGKYIGVFIKG